MDRVFWAHLTAASHAQSSGAMQGHAGPCGPGGAVRPRLVLMRPCHSTEVETEAPTPGQPGGGGFGETGVSLAKALHGARVFCWPTEKAGKVGLDYHSSWAGSSCLIREWGGSQYPDFRVLSRRLGNCLLRGEERAEMQGWECKQLAEETYMRFGPGPLKEPGPFSCST